MRLLLWMGPFHSPPDRAGRSGAKVPGTTTGTRRRWWSGHTDWANAQEDVHRNVTCAMCAGCGGRVPSVVAPKEQTVAELIALARSGV